MTSCALQQDVQDVNDDVTVSIERVSVVTSTVDGCRAEGGGGRRWKEGWREVLRTGAQCRVVLVWGRNDA